MLGLRSQSCRNTHQFVANYTSNPDFTSPPDIYSSLTMKSITIIAALAGIVVALPAAINNTPKPMLPGANPSCEDYFLASPGVSCWSMATEHGLSIDEFIRINPQVPPAGGCEDGGIRPHFWYCVKDGAPREQAVAQPTFYRHPAPTSKTPPPKPTPTSTKAKPTPPPPPPPTSTPGIELNCEVNDCYRGFLKIVPQLRDTYTRFCSEILESGCTANTITDLGAPTIITNECPQNQPCQAVSSACACYLAGVMGEGPQTPPPKILGEYK
ncbi:hypothetical protein F5X68DRAFT_243028 [Plectosphaerella plurivora]|uniref:LysM domain-containing protein n=1 Tax=Plectosphaerella plurivora TaxID=936078 RepID=A0A9P8V913_9PEZI|nr:hypothetical protein F5X68DRAFT_243028 [Plectosphaerella plurivora]